MQFHTGQFYDERGSFARFTLAFDLYTSIVLFYDSLDDAQCANEAQVRFVGKISPSPTINIFNHTQYHTLVNDLRELIEVLGLS